MSIDFSTLQGLTIPEGTVTQIVSNGEVLWCANGAETPESDEVILKVAKVQSSTATDTMQYIEKFVLLAIYPKSGGTVRVTYGGVTKTITDTSGAEEPDAQQVFFGTLYGVSDSVETPESGELTISGEYRGFGIGTYNYTKTTIQYCKCIRSVVDFGISEFIPDNAFGGSVGNVYNGCSLIESITIPASIISIGNYAFVGCQELSNVSIGDGVISIGSYAFDNCAQLESITIPASVISIGNYAFRLKQGDTRTVTMLSATPPTLGGAGTFELMGTNNIIVPAGSGDAYKTAEYWSEYADYITEAT